MVLNIGIYVYIEYLIIFIVIKVLEVKMACDNLPQGLWQVAPWWGQKVSLDSEHKMFKIFDKERSYVSYNVFYHYLKHCWKFLSGRVFKISKEDMKMIQFVIFVTSSPTLPYTFTELDFSAWQGCTGFRANLKVCTKTKKVDSHCFRPISLSFK